MAGLRPTARLIATVAVMLLGTSCGAALPRVDPLADTAVVDLTWENRSDRRYFLTVGDPRDNTLSRWFVIEPCQKAGVWGVVVTMPDDIGLGEAGDAEAPAGPMSGAVDSLSLLDYPQWVFTMAQEDPPDDMLGNLVSDWPVDQHVGPFEAE